MPYCQAWPLSPNEINPSQQGDVSVTNFWRLFVNCTGSAGEMEEASLWNDLVCLVFSFKIYPDLLVIDWMVRLLTWGLWSSLHVLLDIKLKQWIQTIFTLKTDSSEVLTEMLEVICSLQGTYCLQPGPNDCVQRMAMEKSDQFRIKITDDHYSMSISSN